MIPRITYSTCPRCGSKGVEVASDDASTTNLEDGSGYELTLFRGKYLCDICINEIKMDEESLDMAANHRREERFRSRAGFN